MNIVVPQFFRSHLPPEINAAKQQFIPVAADDLPGDGVPEIQRTNFRKLSILQIQTHQPFPGEVGKAGIPTGVCSQLLCDHINSTVISKYHSLQLQSGFKGVYLSALRAVKICPIQYGGPALRFHLPI